MEKRDHRRLPGPAALLEKSTAKSLRCGGCQVAAENCTMKFDIQDKIGLNPQFTCSQSRQEGYSLGRCSRAQTGTLAIQDRCGRLLPQRRVLRDGVRRGALHHRRSCPCQRPLFASRSSRSLSPYPSPSLRTGHRSGCSLSKRRSQSPFLFYWDGWPSTCLVISGGLGGA
jgi:hypothetical protein